MGLSVLQREGFRNLSLFIWRLCLPLVPSLGWGRGIFWPDLVVVGLRPCAVCWEVALPSDPSVRWMGGRRQSGLWQAGLSLPCLLDSAPTVSLGEVSGLVLNPNLRAGRCGTWSVCQEAASAVFLKGKAAPIPM